MLLDWLLDTALGQSADQAPAENAVLHLLCDRESHLRSYSHALQLKYPSSNDRAEGRDLHVSTAISPFKVNSTQIMLSIALSEEPVFNLYGQPIPLLAGVTAPALLKTENAIPRILQILAQSEDADRFANSIDDALDTANLPADVSQEDVQEVVSMVNLTVMISPDVLP